MERSSSAVDQAAFLSQPLEQQMLTLVEGQKLADLRYQQIQEQMLKFQQHFGDVQQCLHQLIAHQQSQSDLY